jgi:dienelactone hydrolase
VRIEEIDYEVGGRRMVGQLAVDEYRPGLRPAVLLCHEGLGLDEHVKGRAVRLAGLGYVAFALDYQGQGEGQGKSALREEAMARLAVLMPDADLTRSLARAGLDVLLAQEQVDPGQVAAIGYCFGGAMALELARTGADVKAVVGFHPSLTSPKPADSCNIKGAVLMCCGADDPLVTGEQRLAFEAEMKEARVANWRIEVYGGVGHAFSNPRISELGWPGVRIRRRGRSPLVAGDARSLRRDTRLRELRACAGTSISGLETNAILV